MNRIRLALSLLVLAPVSGCVWHSGGWTEADSAAPAPAVDQAPVSLVLVGNPGAPTRWAEQVGAELDARLIAEHDAGREPVVIWLGGLSIPRHPGRRRPDCPTDPALSSRPGAAAVADAVTRHVGRGHASYAVPGVSDWDCGLADALVQKDPSAGPNPWTMPAHHYVVRVGTDGRSSVISGCDGSTCTLSPGASDDDDDGTLVDLVFVDLVPWIAFPSDDADRARKDAEIARLDSLIAAVTATAQGDSPAPPRVLVSSVPVEGYGFAGMGGGGADAAYHFMPVALQDALRDGVFAGSIGAHDRAVYATADITPAVKRSSRAWLSAPMFEVVSGSASLPDSRAGASHRRVRYYRSNSGRADVYSDRPGFAVVYVGEQQVSAHLYAAKGRGWERASIEAPLSPAPHPVETASPILTPCQRCPRIPADER